MKTSKIFIGLILSFVIATSGIAQTTEDQTTPGQTPQDQTQPGQTPDQTQQEQTQQGQMASYDKWDRNRDNRVDKDEFSSAYSQDSNFKSWNSTNAQGINENEWNQRMSSTYRNNDFETEGMFDDWDADNNDYLDNDELAEGNFELWDEDDSGYIEEDEYNTWNEDRG